MLGLPCTCPQSPQLGSIPHTGVGAWGMPKEASICECMRMCMLRRGERMCVYAGGSVCVRALK